VPATGVARRAAGGPPEAEPGADAGPAAPRSGAGLIAKRCHSAVSSIGAASSSRSQVTESAGSAYAFLTCNASSISVPWRPSLSTVVVTHFVTQLVCAYSSCPLRRWLAARTLPRMGQLVEAAWKTVSGTAIVGVAGFGTATSTRHTGAWRMPAQKVLAERTKAYDRKQSALAAIRSVVNSASRAEVVDQTGEV
jgi:uncharacterized protein YegP (UPF0339 family)